MHAVRPMLLPLKSNFNPIHPTKVASQTLGPAHPLLQHARRNTHPNPNPEPKNHSPLSLNHPLPPRFPSLCASAKTSFKLTTSAALRPPFRSSCAKGSGSPSSKRSFTQQTAPMTRAHGAESARGKEANPRRRQKTAVLRCPFSSGNESPWPAKWEWVLFLSNQKMLVRLRKLVFHLCGGVRSMGGKCKPTASGLNSHILMSKRP